MRNHPSAPDRDRLETRQTTIATPNLKAAMATFQSAQDATYSVAWIDYLGMGGNLGHSLVMLGEHATRNGLCHRSGRKCRSGPSPDKN